jgi:hypothetical protein
MPSWKQDLFGNIYAEERKTPEQEYKDYINSAPWRKLRKAKIVQAGEKCERCGLSKWSVKLEVHHKNYKHFKNERMEELEVLCPDCHSKADDERREEENSDIRFANSSLARGFENWMDRGSNKRWRELNDDQLVKHWRSFLSSLRRKTGRGYDKPFRRSIEWTD